MNHSAVPSNNALYERTRGGNAHAIILCIGRSCAYRIFTCFWMLVLPFLQIACVGPPRARVWCPQPKLQAAEIFRNGSAQFSGTCISAVRWPQATADVNRKQLRSHFPCFRRVQIQLKACRSNYKLPPACREHFGCMLPVEAAASDSRVTDRFELVRKFRLLDLERWSDHA